MGLNRDSTGLKSIDSKPAIEKDTDIVVALLGNPNSGKSTIFNAITGMNQHTGNWPGKTVSNTVGYCRINKQKLAFVDIPGCYSLLAHSPEEEIASEYICSGEADITLIVCDATCLERNLILVYQALDAINNVILCINLIDQAEKKGIKINYKKLQNELKIPVIPICAKNKSGISDLLKSIIKYKPIANTKAYIEYDTETEKIINDKIIQIKFNNNVANLRWAAINKIISEDIIENFEETVVTKTVKAAENTANSVTEFTKKNYDIKDRTIDKIITSKVFAFPLMFFMLSIIFWLTIIGANYPSELLSNMFFFIEDKLFEFLLRFNTPLIIADMIAHGIFRVLAWVIAVMLPPMAIFFPLFSLLEDLGLLPRIAFNLDKCFKKCNACGKQSLTMCMGFGCNAAGVVGCRIIDSPRERIIAIITNSFVPCNGRFPAIISIISMFLIASSYSFSKSILTSLFLSMFIILGIVITLLTSRLLSKTLLKGVPSSFTLELPPYRRPQITRTIISSLLDRAVFVLGRAACVAAPAGLIIWLFANINISGESVLSIASNFLDPLGELLGLDGVIILAFILGFPANEIVIPIIIMAYMSSNTLIEINDLSQLKILFINNGWTTVTALNTIIFSLCHWPCSTTLLTIKKETQSIKWTLIALILPTTVGIVLCFLVNMLSKFFA